MTFPTNIVPKTTKLTAGRITYVNLAKRKLEFEEQEERVVSVPPSPLKSPVQRHLRHRTILSHGSATCQNKLYYHLLHDGVISASAAKGTTNEAPGYVQPGIEAGNTMLTAIEDGNPDPITLNAKITPVLPIRDPLTSRAKYLSYTNQTKTMDVKCFVYSYEDSNNNTLENGDKWCRHLITNFNAKFRTLRISYGGNAATSGMSYHMSLDQEFLEDDVARIAWMVYEDEIRNRSLFHDDALMDAYFRNTVDVRGLFSRLYQVWSWVAQCA